MDSNKRASVVLVHGAWADGSSWYDAMAPLQAKGLTVSAAPIPLTSLSDDVAALDRALERTAGPIVLAAHAYAGAVIAASSNERVQSLVFIAALAPDEDETVADVFYREKSHPQAPQLAPDAHGLIWMPTVSTCVPRAGCASCGNTAANRRRVHSREGAKACLEGKTVLVPCCRRRPDDQLSHATLYGETHGGADPAGEGRSHAAGQRARSRHRRYP